MLTEKQLEEALHKIEGRIDRINKLYLKKVGEQINEIGKLSPSSVNKLIQMRKVGASVNEINRELRHVTGLNSSEVYGLYRQAAEELYQEYELSALTKGSKMPPLKDNAPIRKLLESISKVTAATMENYSNTTNISQRYKELVSTAVQATVSGVSDYGSAMRAAIREAAEDGSRVVYESGHTRRLDSAIRMNVIDGVKHLQQEAQMIIGEQIGADGIELTAHPNSAHDHEPCQGRQYTKAEFDKMQNGEDFSDIEGNHYAGFHRPIGEWNCGHFAFAIILGISKRKYSDEQLERWREENNAGCVIDGKHYTNYEAKQLMRQLETKIRQQKDVAIAAKASGDDLLRRQAQKKITDYTAAYKRVAEASGFKPRLERTFVSGFKDNNKNFVLQSETDGGKVIPKKDEGLGVNLLGKLDIEKYKGIAKNPLSDEVVITDAQIQHIIDRRGVEFYEKYQREFINILNDPDYIFNATRANTAIAVKTFAEGGNTVNVVLRLVVKGDDPKYKNSIITAINEGEKRFQQRLRNNTPIYRKTVDSM